MLSVTLREAYYFLHRSQSEIEDGVANLPLTLRASHDAIVSQIGDRLQAMEERMLAVFDPSPSLCRPALIETHTEAQQEAGLISHHWQSSPKRTLTLEAEPLPRRASLCGMDCICACHQPIRVSYVTALMRSFVGILAATYSARGLQPCTNPLCRDFRRQQPSRDLRVVYHLPAWLSRISVSVFLSTNLNGTPQMSLCVYYGVLEDSELSHFSQLLVGSGDIERIKIASRKGQASVCAIHQRGGGSLLWGALVFRKASMLKLLLRAGADPFAEVHHGQSVMTLAFSYFNNGSARDRELATFFPVSQYLEELDLPRLHLSVLEITHVDLRKALQTPTYSRDINRKIRGGFTPLHLAAIRGNAAAAELLIQAGADVDAVTKRGNTPLHLTSLYGHYDAAEALAHGGAGIDAVDNDGRTPLHNAACCENSHAAKVTSLLLRHRANVNALTHTQSTPLHCAAIYGTTQGVKFLLEHEADANAVDAGNVPAILYAAMTCKYDAVRDLLPRVRAPTLSRISSYDGRGLLHELAAYGTAEMVDLFTVNVDKLRGCSTSLPDFEGKTPTQILNERNPAYEIRTAMENLLAKVEALNNVSSSPGDAGSDDEFFDAEENS